MEGKLFFHPLTRTLRANPFRNEYRMFIPSSLYRAAYDLILDRTRGHNSCCTYLLVAPEVDALCAARLLSSLLKTDDVQHLTIPVGSYPELDVEARKLRELPDGDVSKRDQSRKKREMGLIVVSQSIGSKLDHDWIGSFSRSLCTLRTTQR